MNCWWILVMPLSLLWALPMYGAHRAQMPAIFFVAVAAFWAAVFVFVVPLYDWGTSLAQKLGHYRLADFRERLKPKVLTPTRIALLLMAAISAVFAML